MKSFGWALFLSLAFHGLIAAGIAVCMGRAPAPGEMAQLDLTSVDLSFAETPDETADAVPASAPMPKAHPPKPSEPEAELPLEPEEDAHAAGPKMSRPDTSDLPKPEATRENMETPPPLSESAPAPAVAPRQAKVDAPPKPRRNIRPDYPRESRLRGEQGNVALEIDVSELGTVDGVRIVASSGFPLLDEAAVKAVHSARFMPAKSNGKPVSSVARLTLDFKLK